MITIIILLILATVTITTLTGENGLFSRAKQAKENTAIGQERESISLARMSLLSKFQEENEENLENEIELVSQKRVEVKQSGDKNFLVTYEDSKRRYEVAKDGEISLLEDEEAVYRVIQAKYNRVLVLKDGKDLFLFEKDISESGFYQFREEEAEKVLTNVKEFRDPYVITEDGNLYEINYYLELNLLGSDVDRFWRDDDGRVVGKDGHLYSIHPYYRRIGVGSL